MAILFFILLIGLLVLVHEFGHFFVAKRLGIRVEEFAFGFPPRLWSIMRGGTRYAVNLLPFGGYVKIFGESGEGEGNPESFISRPARQRFIIIGAGVLMNIVLAWFLFSVGAGIGLPTAVTDENEARVKNVKVGIIGVEAKSPAHEADIRFGDIVIQAQSVEVAREIREPEDLQLLIDEHRGEEMILLIGRGKEMLKKKIIPRVSPPEGQGPLGIVLSKVGTIQSPWYRAGLDGLLMTTRALSGIVLGFFGLLKDLFFTGRVSADIAGPVGIFVFARHFGELGVAYLLQLAAILSINLAVLNALPFPALDGGRMLFLGIEKVKGSRVDQKWERAIHTAGFVILMLLMLAVTYRDIVKIF